MSLPPANWYPDPWDPAMSRYWDGVAWTGHTQATVSPPPQPVAPVAPVAQRDDQGYDAIGGRILTPAYGHVMTPGVEPEPLAPYTPYRKAPRRSVGKLLVKIVLGVAVFFAAGATTEYVLTEVFGPRTEAAAPLVTNVHASDAPIPSGWVTYTSRSGAVTYAHDPLWNDLLTPTVEEDFFAELGAHPLMTFEYAGYWQTGHNALDSGDVVQVLAASYVVADVQPRLEVHSFVAGDLEAVGDVESTVLSDESFTSTTGYAGWLEHYSVTVGGETIYAGAIGVTDGVTLVIASVGSINPPAAWEGYLVALANSIVIEGKAKDL